MAAKLGIPFYVLNFEEAFKNHVVDYFVDGYEQGVTPNPCVECNRNVKFGLFLDKMRELGADYVATGHYARVIPKKRGGKTEYELHTAKDKTKDQSYFLYTLGQEKLKHILFPIGEFTKPEVREMAKKYGIDEVNKVKESQNLCFFPEGNYGPFLKRYLKTRNLETGPIVTVNGEVIGTHKGLPNYTIGQRKGLFIGGLKGHEAEQGQGWYVVQIDKNKNQLIVGREQDLFTQRFTATSLNFTSDQAPSIADLKNLKAKIRYRFPGQDIYFNQLDLQTNSAEIEFQKPQRAITPGQSVVFYEDEKVVGGGIIAK